MQHKTFVITAAGGNGTAINVLPHPLSRGDYADQGKQLGKTMEQYGAEQAGFLVPSESHFEMAGGEFCGNAARSAAILLSEIERKPQVSFTMSGYDGRVSATVEKTGERTYSVECTFAGLPNDLRETALSDGQRVSVVDLGGIVHVVVDAPFLSKPAIYQAKHRSIMKELGLSDRSAVGVVWIERIGTGIAMHPVVWVRDVDTFFYEQSCGSGTIAVGKVTGVHSIVQPTNQRIEANISRDAVTLRSAMEVVRAD